MKRTGKPFSLDPELSYLKDNVQMATKTKNWKVTAKELRKFGINVPVEKRNQIIMGN
jgi:hypothetical protein